MMIQKSIKRIKKNNKFYFRVDFNDLNTAKICVRRSFSNLFLTLMDSRGQVIICKTSGSCGFTGSKRKKTIKYNIEVLFKEVYEYIKVYRIQQVIIVLRTRVNAYYYTLAQELSYVGIRIGAVYFNRRLPHNGMRGRKLRRI